MGISIIVEPNSNHASELVNAINAATQSIDMTMYEIDDTTVINALAGRAQAGIPVKVILDGSSTCKTWNTPAYNTLHSAGAQVVWSNPAFTYTHEKCVILDGTQAWIMTMNANTSSPRYNREYLAIDTDAADITEATNIFNADFAMQSISPTGNLVVANNNARPMLVNLINSATSTLDIEVEEFSDNYSTGITNAVVAARNRHVAVRIIVANSTPTSNQTTAIATVKSAGATVVMSGGTSSNSTASNPYIHAKAITVDCSGTTCAKAFVGSENFSGGSLGYNRELGVIFSDATQIAKIQSAINTDYAAGTPQ